MLEKINASIDLIERIKTIFQARRAYTLLSSIILTIFIWFFVSNFDLTKEEFADIIPSFYFIRNITIFYLITQLIFTFLWAISRKVPKFEKDEIGFLLAIKTDDNKLKIRLRHDFIQNLTSEMNNVGIKISIKYLSEYHCEKLIENPDISNMSKYHYKTKAQLIIFGYADVRKQNGKDCYYLKLRESVSHSKIPIGESRELNKQMILSFPEKAIIEVNNELFGFEFTGKIFSIATKYILGITCIYSKNLEYALKFHLSLIDSFEANYDTVINLKNLCINAKRLVYDESMHLAANAYLNLKDLALMESYLCIGRKYFETAWYYLLLSILYFLKDRNIDKAITALDKAKKLDKHDFTWAYSKGFLLAYKGELSEAYHVYKLGFKNLTASTTHLECEKFLRDLLEQEPDKIQLLYCLGLIYFFAHKDYLLAKEAFEDFLNRATESSLFPDQMKYVNNYLDVIKSKDCSNR